MALGELGALGGWVGLRGVQGLEEWGTDRRRIGRIGMIEKTGGIERIGGLRGPEASLGLQ